MNILNLVVPLVVGLSMLIGTIIVIKSKNDNHFISFSISLAFGVMILLIIMELVPEALHLLKDNQFKYQILIVSLVLGVVILKIIDFLIPHHDHNHDNPEGEINNLHHIGIVSSIALILHNIIEGMALFAISIESIKLSMLVGIGVGLHNIPMGIIIASTFLEANNSKKKTLLISIGLAVSTFIGALIMFILKNQINETILAALISITAGMLIFISLFELLPQIFCEKNKKLSILGVLTGVTIFIISSIL